MNRRIHIQHVLLSLHPGGLENGAVNVINGMDAERYLSSVCCLQGSGAFAARIRGNGVAIHEMGLRPGNDFGLPFRLARLFRRTRTDIVHTRNPEAFFYGFVGAKLAGVPAIIHSEHGRVLPDRPRRMLVQRWFMRFTQAAFCVSEQLKHDLTRHLRVPSDRLEVIYNGVDVEALSGTDRAAARDVFGAAPSDLVIGSLGRLVPVKNYGLLLRAVNAMQRVDRVLVVLIGEGPERQALEALARNLSTGLRLRMLGHREGAARLLAGMDMFVLPSVSEGMSNTLLEAMAASVPVVASDVGGNREIVQDGNHGLLFANGDEAGLRTRLERLAADPALRARLARAGYERVLRDFSIRAMISQYEELYQRVFHAQGADCEAP